MSYSLNPSSDNCYEGTTCLVNRLGIRDEKRLSEVEAQITFAKAAMLEADPIQGDFGFEHFKRIHEFLLCDLYEWAGQTRTVDISKKRTRFLEASLIEDVAVKCFSKIKDGYFDSLPFDDFVRRIAEFYNEVNYIHPFREGNGRAQRIYFTQLIRHFGYDISFADTDTDELMLATIQASQGVMDFLIEFFAGSISTGEIGEAN